MGCMTRLILEISTAYDNGKYWAQIQAHTNPEEFRDIDDWRTYDLIQEAVAGSGKELIRIAERFQG